MSRSPSNEGSVRDEISQTIECLRFEDSTLDRSSTGIIGDGEIVGWFRGASDLHLDGSRPSTALRLVILPTGTELKDLNEDYENEIHSILGIPTYLIKQLRGRCGRYKITETELALVYHAPNHMSAIPFIIKYDTSTNTAIGLIAVSRVEYVEAIKDIIMKEFMILSHPLLVPTLLLELTLENLSTKIRRNVVDLDEMEEQTGFDEKVQSVERLSTDYRKLAREAGALDTSISFLVSSIQATLRTVDFILREIDLMGDDSLSKPLQDTQAKLANRARVVESSLQYLTDGSALIFNLIAQQDNLLNVEVARDSRELAAASKRDSAAMKIIAFMTTLFLPGTFIATLFAMPLFDWEASDLRSTWSGYLWLYWAVTVPLTAMVMGTMAAYATYQWRQKRLEVEEARKDATDGSSTSSDASTLSKRHAANRLLRRVAFRKRHRSSGANSVVESNADEV